MKKLEAKKCKDARSIKESKWDEKARKREKRKSRKNNNIYIFNNNNKNNNNINNNIILHLRDTRTRRREKDLRYTTECKIEKGESSEKFRKAKNKKKKVCI